MSNKNCPEKYIKKLKICLKEIVHLAVSSIFSFFIIAIFLWAISNRCPSLYKVLTKWANQPPMPIVQSCEFQLVSNSVWDLGNMYPNLRKYNLEYKINSSIGEIAYGISYTEDSRFSIVNEKVTKKLRASNTPYIVFDKRNFKKKPPFVTVYYNAEMGELDELKYEGEECPVRFEFFGDKK